MKIFVSYSRRDAGDFANQIQKHLSTFNYDIFTDIDSIRAGEVWNNTIEENISNCDIFVVIVTHGALQSPYVEKEVLQAQKQNKIIVPCIHEHVEYNKIKWGLQENSGIVFSDKKELDNKSNSFQLDNLYNIIEYYIDKERVRGIKSFSLRPSFEYKLPPIRNNYRFEYNMKGFVLYRQGKYQEAIEYYDKALAIDSSNVEALIGKAKALYHLQKVDEALQYYDKALAIDSSNVEALIGKAFVLANLDKNEDALPLIQKILESDSNNEYYLSIAAFIMYNLGKTQDAKLYFEKALQINPNLKDILSEKELIAFNKVMNNK